MYEICSAHLLEWTVPIKKEEFSEEDSRPFGFVDSNFLFVLFCSELFYVKLLLFEFLTKYSFDASIYIGAMAQALPPLFYYDFWCLIICSSGNSFSKTSYIFYMHNILFLYLVLEIIVPDRFLCK